jgi:hypothetical protein
VIDEAIGRLSDFTMLPDGPDCTVNERNIVASLLKDAFATIANNTFLLLALTIVDTVLACATIALNWVARRE